MKTTIITLVIAATTLAVLPAEANADGPLRRWLRGLRTPRAATTCGYAPATTAQNPYNLQPGQCMKTCQQTCSRTVVNYVPYTAYRTVQQRVPVTQYRPETTSDPVTGCVVTCMKPCTTYTYQCQRVPYTTYRPVYRQESYKVPVTTITNDCSTGNCGTGSPGCDTCGTGQLYSQPNYGPVPTPAPQTSTYYEAPGSITTDGVYGSEGVYGSGGGYSTVPADVTPSLQGVNPTSSQRPVMDRLNSGGGYQAYNEPAAINFNETASRSPVRKEWSYSPVRLASYEKPVTTRAQMAPATLQLIPTTRMAPLSNQVQTATRNGWVEVN